MSNDTPSLFYNHKFGRKFPISLMALEMYAIEVEGAAEDNEVYDALVRVLAKACDVKSPSKEDIEYLISRITTVGKELADNKKESGEGEGKGAKGKSFGTSYMEYLHNLSVDSAILKMVNYDIGAATALYCDIDRDDTMELIAEYFSGAAEENLVKMEASMYGSGNTYKDDKGGKGSADKLKGSSHDISTPEGFANLKAMGL